MDGVCDNLVIVDDFVGLSDDCGATRPATVAWTNIVWHVIWPHVG